MSTHTSEYDAKFINKYCIDCYDNDTECCTKCIECSDESSHCRKCINCSHCEGCIGCIDCTDCVNCTNCIDCHNCADQNKLVCATNIGDITKYMDGGYSREITDPNYKACPEYNLYTK